MSLEIRTEPVTVGTIHCGPNDHRGPLGSARLRWRWKL